MFGGKKEKALEEALEAAKAAETESRETFAKIAGRQDDMTERFAHMMASRNQMEQDISQVTEKLSHVGALSQSGSQAAEELHGAIVAINNGVGTFDVNHSLFMEQVKAQNEAVKEAAERDKNMTASVKSIAEAAASLAEKRQQLHEHTGRMMEFSKSMGVLSLNAAIEAGRMGEAGMKFITAAEEVRSFSEQYESEAKAIEAQLAASDEKIAELEAQVQQLNELLKESNQSMGKLLMDCMQNTATYEQSQLDLRGLLPDTLVGKSDALQRVQLECAETGEHIGAVMESLSEELKEQKESADALEQICEEVVTAAKNGTKA